MAYKFEARLKEIIKDTGDFVDSEQINDDVDLVRDLGFTSINIIQLIIELEDVFEIEIDDDNLLQEKLSSYRNLVEIIKDKLDEDKLK